MMKLYGTILVLLIILSSCGSVCASNPVHHEYNYIQTHIDINGKSTYEHINLEKGKNMTIKAELWADKSCFGHNKPIAHDSLIVCIFYKDDHYKLMSSSLLLTNLYGNAYQSFQTGQLEKGDYVITVFYGGGEYDLFQESYNSSSKAITISVI